MRYSTTASGMILAAMTIGDAMAGPTHAHLHRRAHEKKDIDYSTIKWDALSVDWTSAYLAGQASKTAAAAPVATVAAEKVANAPAVATSSTSAAAAATTQASTSSGSSSTSSSTTSSLFGMANALTSFGAATKPLGSVIAKIGNIGYPQGSNMIKVSSRTGYDFTNEFINTSGEDMTVVCWNKAAYKGTDNSTLYTDPDSHANLGASIAPTQAALTFDLPVGASQIVAFMNDTQFGCAQKVDKTVFSGGYDTTWLEGNFCDTGSGYDVSAIQNTNNNNYDMTITSTEAPQCTSSRTENMWLNDKTPVGTSDGSCYIMQSHATLTTKMGGTI